jgi:hypothetical protein
MKTTKTVKVTIEEKDLKPLFDKALAGVAGTEITHVGTRFVGKCDARNGEALNPTAIELEVTVKIDEEIK